MHNKTWHACILVILLPAIGWASAPQAVPPVAHYTFDEGAGDVLHDRSGHGHHGRIVGARWATASGRSELVFNGAGDHVDLGDTRTLKSTGDVTVLVWLRLDASPYPNDQTNWAVVDCESYADEGYILRVDGAACKLMYRACRKGSEVYAFGKTVLENRKAYLVGFVRKGQQVTTYVDGSPEAQFNGNPPEFGKVPLKLGSAGQSFHGAMHEALFYDRALSMGEVVALYWQQAERYGKNVSSRGKIGLRSFVYHHQKQACAAADFFGVMPIAEGEEAFIELLPRGGQPIASHRVDRLAERNKDEHAFSLAGLTDGEYELRARLKGSGRSVASSVSFRLPEPPVVVPSTAVTVVDPLPQAAPQPDFRLRPAGGGGFYIDCMGASFGIESEFSYPNGGQNRLICAGQPDSKPEPSWRVSQRSVTPTVLEIEAGGAHYQIKRRVTAQKGRCLVVDTITNRTSAPIGLLFGNRLCVPRDKVECAYILGAQTTLPVSLRPIKTCPAMSLRTKGGGPGFGLVALDDVYIVQSRATFDDRGLELASSEFALDAGASYTLEWAIYVNATGDYYDVINAVRRDEGRNGVTVKGGWAAVPGSMERRDASLAPPSDFYTIRGLAYVCLSCLSWCTDDPEVSVEGFEFVECPKERRKVRELLDAIARIYPQGKRMFHVAQQLYVTSKPAEKFPDSRVIDADGKQTVFPYPYGNGRYFSRRRYDEGWRWWIFYPTLNNSFGKAMLNSIDVMMDEMGATGVFLDGFLWGYGGEYTYDCWDGHSADIDPNTRTLRRKKGSVILLTQHAMAAYCEKVRAKGGAVVANNVIVTRTIGRQPIVIDREISEGPDVHLAQTPVTLGNPGAIINEEDVYRDVLSKLRWGNLYFYYGEPAKLTHESLPAQMFPITVDEVRSGSIRGRERWITLRSGIYGWSGDRSLHQAFRYDARGRRIRPDFLTTVDASSVRTRIILNEDESAVLVRLPVRIESPSPVNAMVEEYDGKTLKMALNGGGRIRIVPLDGTPADVELNGQRSLSLPLSGGRR